MDDAAEAHDTILWALHKAAHNISSKETQIKKSNDAKHSKYCDCIIHNIFGLFVGEEASCSKCSCKMQTPPYDTMVISASISLLQENIQCVYILFYVPN